MNDGVSRRAVLPGGTVLSTEEGSQVIVGEMINKGGEGYLQSVKDSPDQAAKIYHIHIGNREQKLKDMIASNPNIKGVCWPEHLLYDQNGEFVGFLMPKLPEGALSVRDSVFLLDPRTEEQEVLPGWDRKDITNTAKLVAEMISRLHERGILMGDLNDRNVMLDPDDKSAVYLVDCDSYQFKNYPCPVGTDDYTHPGIAERLGVSRVLDFSEVFRTEKEENYALGILIYRILLLGRHPFRCEGKSLIRAMRERIFPDYDKDPDTDARLIRMNLLSSIDAEFIKTFRNQKPTKAYIWAEILGSFLEFYDKEKFTYTRDLFPKTPKYYNKEALTDELQTCERCGTTFEMSKWECYEREGLGEPILCSRCDADIENEIEYIENSEDSEEKPKCANLSRNGCKNTAELATKALYIKWIKGEKVYCKKCSEKVTITCAVCDKSAKIYKWKVEENAKQGRENLCWDCIEIIKNGEPKCANLLKYGCKNTVWLTKAVYTKWKKGEKVYCKKCSEKVTITCAICGKTDKIFKPLVEENMKQGRGNLCTGCVKAKR